MVTSPHKVANLRFPLSQVQQLSDRYAYQNDDGLVELLVPEVREQGYLTKAQLLEVVEWKAPRSRRHARSAPETLVIEATRLLFNTRSEQLRIGVPSLIPGVGYPMASVLLHFFHPEPYPIIDYRALWSLGLEQQSAYYTFEAWWTYVEACRSLSAQAGVDMRTFDRALWQYSKESQPN